MVQVLPFRGIRYRPEAVPLEAVLAPPFDVIGEELQAELYGRAMQNVVRIELGRDFEDDVPGSQDRYTRARDHLRIWLQSGVMVLDEERAVYLHRHSFRPPGLGGPRHRLGCFVAIEPVGYELGQVLRHELTLSGPRQDRVRLLEATGTQTSPVLLLYEGAKALAAALEQVSLREQPIAEAVVEGEYGPERHQLWRLTGDELLTPILSELSAARLFIADGHHRYQTALDLGLPRILALLAPLEGPGTVILATHRVVPDSPLRLQQLGERLGASGWEVEGGVEAPDIPEWLAPMRERRHAFGILDGSSALLVSRERRPSAAPTLGLDVSVLKTEILEPLLGITGEAAEAGRLRYTRDPLEASRIAAETEGLAFLVNPTSVEEVVAVSEAGEQMPQKSTYFFPKVPTGLVLMPLEESGPEFGPSPDSGRV